MIVLVGESVVEGVLKAPPSKSVTHRALVCSSLAGGGSEVISPLVCDDTEATLEALQALGASFRVEGERLSVEGCKLRAPGREIYCRSSGTTLRFMTAVSSLADGECKLTGSSGLMRRPIEPLLDALRQLGVECRLEGAAVFVKGRPKGGEARVRGEISSQFISALLLIAPLCERETVIACDKISSKPYVSLTLDVQRRFGVEISWTDIFEVEPQRYRPATFTVEGDWSSAANILVAAALCGKVTVEGLRLESVQADKRIVDILKAMEAKVTVEEDKVTVEKSNLEAIEFDVTDCPDLFPPLCVLCAQARGTSTIYGVERLKFKESDRVKVMVENLRKMGVRVELGENLLKISGTKVSGATINPYNDHRIAMALATLALTAEGGTRIMDGECVGKSFPQFWSALKGLGAEVRVVG